MVGSQAKRGRKRVNLPGIWSWEGNHKCQSLGGDRVEQWFLIRLESSDFVLLETCSSLEIFLIVPAGCGGSATNNQRVENRDIAKYLKISKQLPLHTKNDLAKNVNSGVEIGIWGLEEALSLDFSNPKLVIFSHLRTSLLTFAEGLSYAYVTSLL